MEPIWQSVCQHAGSPGLHPSSTELSLVVMTGISEFGKQRQEDYELEASQSHTGRPSIKETKPKIEASAKSKVHTSFLKRHLNAKRTRKVAEEN